MSRIATKYGEIDGHMGTLGSVVSGVQDSINSLRATSNQLMSTFDGKTATAYSDHHRKLNMHLDEVQEHVNRAKAAGSAHLGSNGSLNDCDTMCSNKFPA